MGKSLNLPLISCLTITKNRLTLLKRSIKNFLDQTYSNKELIIINEGSKDYKLKVDSFLNKLNNSCKIVHKKVHSDNYVLGELRNKSIDMSNGDYLLTWDDDDLSSNDRIEKQFELMGNYDASVLANFNVYSTHSNKCYECHSMYGHHGTLMWKKSDVRFSSMKKGEDTDFIRKLNNCKSDRTDLIFKKGVKILLNHPRLFEYNYHHENTSGHDHISKIIKYGKFPKLIIRCNLCLFTMKYIFKILKFLKDRVTSLTSFN